MSHKPAPGSLDLDQILERYKDYLAKHKLKFTVQRKLIISEFFRAGGHITAEELFRLTKKKDAGVGLASVYRTINSLVESGLAVERRFLDKTSVYEIHEQGHHHDHLICTRCRKIFEFENDKIEALQLEVAKSLGFSLQDHRLELYGYCQRTNCPNL
jgi:Fur family transcriptional regulator, ferric uptake regulator